VIEWKLFWTGTATVLAIVLAALAATGLLPAPLVGAIALALTLGVGAISYAVVEVCEMWRGAAEEQLRRIWFGISGAAVTYLVWTLFAIVAPMTWRYGSTLAVALGLLSTGVYWAARYMEWHLARVPAPRARTIEDDIDELLGPREKRLAAALRLAKIKGVQVLPGTKELRAGAGRQFRVRRLPGAQNDLTLASMELLAIALAKILGEDIHSDWVRYRKESAAGVYSITVLYRDLMAEVIPYVDDPTPTSITEPALRGVEVDGREYREPLTQHERDIGASTMGKSSLENVKIAHSTRCTDAITWIAGVQKLYDLVGPWVEPYLDTGLRPPIDWIGHGQTDTLAMMASAMNIARWRQRQPMNRRRWKAIVLYLDEFSFTAQSRQRILFAGDWVDAGWLASALFRGAASANIHVHLATQRSTLDHFGDHGGDVVANLAVNSAFASKDWAEIGRMTNDYKLPSPKWPGEYYLLSNAAPVNLKAPYIQTPDPTKPRLHDGATIAEISWARRHIPRDGGHGLAESEGLTAAGAAYAARHQIVDDRFMAYLTDTESTETEGEVADEHRETYDSVRSQLENLAKQAGLDLPGASSSSGGAEPRRPDAIITVLDGSRTEHPDGMTAAQVADELNTRGDTATAEAVAATLSRMCNRGQIHRVGHGRYTALDQTNDQTNT
jgi:hypothetical protein